MAMKNFLWRMVDGQPQQLPAHQPLWLHLTEHGLEPSAERGSSAVLLAPISPIGEHVAIVLVANDCPSDVVRNGRPLSAGIWALKHADRLEVDGHPIWIAIDATHDETRYDPAVHGSDVWCFITKARLVCADEADEIAICPGTSSKACGSIYKLSAWRLAQKGSRPFKCPNCGYMPTKAAWQPVVPQPTKTLDNLFEIIARGAL